MKKGQDFAFGHARPRRDRGDMAAECGSWFAFPGLLLQGPEPKETHSGR